MRISEKYKFVYLSKPKCASTTMRNILDPYCDVFSSDQYPYHHHVKAFELKKIFEEKGKTWDDYFKFITVRNPWSMVVSWYSYAKPDKNGRYWYESRWYKENDRIGFNDWIKRCIRTYHKYYYLNNKLYSDGMFTRDFSGITLDNYILDRDGRVLVDKVIKVEEIEKGVKEVFNHLGINSEELIVKKTNTTSHKHYREYYTKETRQIIAEQFKFDIVFGNYEF